MSSRRCEPVVMSSQASSQYPEHPYRNGSPSLSQSCTSSAGRRHQRREKQSSNILFSILSRQMDIQASEAASRYPNTATDDSNEMEIGASEVDTQGLCKDLRLVLNSVPCNFSSNVKQKFINLPKKMENDVEWRRDEETSRTPSSERFLNGDAPDGVSSDESLHSGNGSGGDTVILRSSSTRSTEDIVEQARNKMTRLSTDGTTYDSSSESSVVRSNDSPIMAASTETLSNPGTPRSPVCVEVHRKYSMGNQDASSARDSIASPVDLSCKRKRVESCSIPANRRAPAVVVGDNCSSLLGATAADKSLLGATLRGRSSTFSTSSYSASASGKPNALDVSLLEAALRGRSSTFSIGMHPSLSNYSPYFNRKSAQFWSSPQQHVTLAKRNLNPVKSRVLERLTTMTLFVLELPEFCALPLDDQRTLLIGSMHRLLLLFMAESNLEFAVTTVQIDNAVDMEEGREPDANGASEKRRRAEVPTIQFVESVQNFIGKCQAINIRPSEYFFMRWIILFHSGLNKLECRDAVNNLNTAARQDLQEIIAHSHPSDKLRYSKLLLALHTAYGINCSMLEQLFCAPLCLGGGIRGFVTDLLNSRNGHAADMMFTGEQEH